MSDKKSKEDLSRGSHRSSSNRSRPKFVITNAGGKLKLNKMSLSQAELNTLAKIKSEEMRLKKSTSLGHTPAKPITANNHAKTPISKQNKKKKEDRMMKNTNVDSLPVKYAVLCDDCKRRTIEIVSCGTARIEKGGFDVANGSS